MSRAATVEGGERLRLFLGLCLPDDAKRRLADWQGAELSGRIVPPENLHVTLAFLGPRPRSDLDCVAGELDAAARPACPPVLVPRGYRETRSVGMLVLDDLDASAAALAVDLHGRLARLGVYRPEARPWLPHVTVLRFRERPGLRPPLPDLGRVVPSEAAVFLSVLRPSGAQYQVLHSVALGG
jgi:RNA 2',3'-cyclic 3'-phosphodiesterase